MSKYKVGDKVKVREDLVVDNLYGSDIFVDGMVELKGKEVTIESVYDYSDEYRIKELGFTWTSEMFEGLVDKPKYVKCIDNIGGDDNGLELNKIYEVEYNLSAGYKLVGMNNYIFFKYRFIEVDSPTEPSQSIPNKGTIKYRITDDGITYTTLNGSKTGKSVKSGKDESRNEVGILIATARALGFNEDKISGIVDVLFDDDSYNSKAKCENAIMKNDIARALSILDKYKE